LPKIKIIEKYFIEAFGVFFIQAFLQATFKLTVVIAPPQRDARKPGLLLYKFLLNILY
jgi:hypothetical protein